MSLAELAAQVIAIWEANPKRQALAKMLNLHPSQISDEMITRVERGARCYRSPNLQQLPRSPRKVKR
jgi:hypothetical protein